MATCLKERYFNECPVCLEVYVQPQILTCNHSLCKTCSDRLTFRGSIKCPLCCKPCSRKDVKPDFRLSQFLEVLAERESGVKGITKDEVDCMRTFPASKHSSTNAKEEPGQKSRGLEAFTEPESDVKGISKLEADFKGLFIFFVSVQALTYSCKGRTRPRK